MTLKIYRFKIILYEDLAISEGDTRAVIRSGFDVQRGCTSIATSQSSVTLTAGTDYEAPVGESFVRDVVQD